MKNTIKTCFIIFCALGLVFQLNGADLPPQKVNLRLNDLTTIVVGRAELSGTIDEGKGPRVKNSVAGFYAPDITATFTVIAPQEDDYAVSVIISSPTAETMEIACGSSVLTTTSIPKTWEGTPLYWRQEIPGLLHLTKGENSITFRLPKVATGRPKRNLRSPIYRPMKEEFNLVSIELGTPTARKAQQKRAKKIHKKADWMSKGKYGLFVHWSANSTGYFTPEKRGRWFQESVKMFDVQHFAEQVARTGAAWVTFTATHQGFYWPAPSKAVDAVMPNRTSKRDLLGEIIDELDKRGIKTLFYIHSGYNGLESTPWRKAIGADYSLANSSKFNDNMVAILRECSMRYGKKLKGFGYIDGCLMHDYPLDPHWESWAKAIKAGNPDALIGFSSNLGPSVSVFSELSTRDGGGGLSQPTTDQIGFGKQYGDVAPAWWCFMDSWLINKPMNATWSQYKPVHKEQQYVDYFKSMAKKGIPVTINLLMTSEVTKDHPIFNPKCMGIMEEVRKAVRGK